VIVAFPLNELPEDILRLFLQGTTEAGNDPFSSAVSAALEAELSRRRHDPDAAPGLLTLPLLDIEHIRIVIANVLRSVTALGHAVALANDPAFSARALLGARFLAAVSAALEQQIEGPMN
jgi:hypothetical protein